MKAAYLLALLPALCLAEPATVIRATELRQAPATDAAVLAPLAESAKVETLERKGGWTRVRAGGGAEGWVRMLLLRYAGAGEAKTGDSGVVQLLNAARSGSSGTQVTTGVRGLDAEQIARAKPNEAELKKLQGYAASAAAAADFAAGGQLHAQKVPYPKAGG